MPRFMILIKADAGAEAQTAPPAKILEEMTSFNESLNNAGILLGGEGFLPTSRDSYRLKYSPDGVSDVTSGPFDVTKEDHVCGFWIWKTTDVDEALQWAKKIPFKAGEVVMRRIADAEDMGEGFSSELQSREDKMRKDVEERVKAQ